jgi:hypothetical protein
MRVTVHLGRYLTPADSHCARDWGLLGWVSNGSGSRIREVVGAGAGGVLHRGGDELPMHYLLIAAFVLLFGQSLSRIVTLTRDHIDINGQQTRLLLVLQPEFVMCGVAA